ncbi:hypothetical protein CPB84DRAFT_379184 [Gymnopilus junonius]|uniref:BCS1 N-terminal domain-containing protein n=1 Tax=Gymnopilus junonius TaxID=109634 RepID=A0A9P5N9U8_GYMJU|nr:hypothetical protein CPB84DRAFT_379184 [Gymnopilus junonius]
MSAEESYQGSSWFPSDNNFSRIAGFSFIVSVLRGLLNSQGTVTGDVGAGVRGPNSYLIDSLKLLLLGWIIEGGRRFLAWVMGRFKPLQYSITAQFVESDPTYEWLILFLTEEKIWSRSRHFYVNATSSKRRWSVTLESEREKRG